MQGWNLVPFSLLLNHEAVPIPDSFCHLPRIRMRCCRQRTITLRGVMWRVCLVIKATKKLTKRQLSQPLQQDCCSVAKLEIAIILQSEIQQKHIRYPAVKPYGKSGGRRRLALLQCSVIQTISFLPKSTHEKYHFFIIPSFRGGVNLICKKTQKSLLIFIVAALFLISFALRTFKYASLINQRPPCYNRKFPALFGTWRLSLFWTIRARENRIRLLYDLKFRQSLT